MDLAQLIQTHKGGSYRDLSERCGGSPSHQRIQQLASGAVKEWMEPDNIRSLARGLGVSERTVVLALAESMGLQVAGDSRISNYLPADTDSLTSRQMQALGNLVRSITDPDEEGDPDAGDAEAGQTIAVVTPEAIHEDELQQMPAPDPRPGTAAPPTTPPE